KLGVLFTSTGPGAANAVGGLVEARFAGTPLLHITGQTSTRFVDRGMGTVHDVPDQLGMLRSTGKAAYRIRTAQEAFGILTRAAVGPFSAASGPVSMEGPTDIQRAEVARPEALDAFVLRLPAPRRRAEADIERLATLVLGARRPMLWLGNGAAAAGPAV